MQDEQLMLERFRDDPDIQQALTFVLGTLKGVSKAQIARDLDISRQWLHQLERKWEEDGTLSRIYQELLNERSRAIQIEVDATLAEFPTMIREAKRIALHSTSDRVRLEAMEWLYQRIIQPALEGKTESGAKELAYSRSDQEFDPTAIPDGDIQVIVETRMPTIIDAKPKR